jgi:hypothetical protein
MGCAVLATNPEVDIESLGHRSILRSDVLTILRELLA